MRRLALLAVLPMALCDTAAAEWVLLGAVPQGRSPLGEYTIYADPATVVRSGDTAALWFLMDFQESQAPPSAAGGGQPYLSQKFHWQFDCKARQWRTLSASVHAAHMGAGEPAVPPDPAPTGWQAVPPTTLMEVYWKLVCSRS